MKHTSTIGFILSLIAISIALYSMATQKKAGVVDILELVNKYHYKIELVKRLEGELRFQKDEVDSLKQVFKTSKSQEIQKALLLKESTFQSSLEFSNKQIDEQVWKRLNPLIDEFGKLHGYDVIYGANGMGSILFCEENNTITHDVLTFINAKYNGN